MDHRLPMDYLNLVSCDKFNHHQKFSGSRVRQNTKATSFVNHEDLAIIVYSNAMWVIEPGVEKSVPLLNTLTIVPA